MIEPDSIVHYVIAAASGGVGALSAFYALRSRVETMLQRIVDLEGMVERRVKTLETDTVKLGSCQGCQHTLESKLEAFHKEGLSEAKAARELAAIEVTNVKALLELMREGQRDLRELVGNMQKEFREQSTTLLDRQRDIMSTLKIKTGNGL